METKKEFICNGAISGDSLSSEKPCSAGPCEAKVNAGFEPCHCILFGDDGIHVPNWEEKTSPEFLPPATYQGVPVPHMVSKDKLDETLSDPENVKKFLAGVCTDKFIGSCYGMCCDQCLFASDEEEDIDNRPLREQWLKDHGYAIPQENESPALETDDSDKPVVDGADVFPSCPVSEDVGGPYRSRLQIIKSTSQLDEVFDSLGVTATVNEIYEALVQKEFDVYTLCAYIATSKGR